MRNSIFYDTDGLRTSEPYKVSKVKVCNMDSIPMWLYVGNGYKSEYFVDYCSDRLSEENLPSEEFIIRDLSTDDIVCLICLPESLLEFHEDISKIITEHISMYYKSFYKIIEFDSYDNLRKYLKLCENINEIRYDNKRKVFYYKVFAKDSSVWADYGNISFVAPLRYNNCKIANEMFL